jgi:hypothetical protein
MRRPISNDVHAGMRVIVGCLLGLLLGTHVLAQETKVNPVPGKPVLLLSGFDLAPLGYAIDEFFVSGSATSYSLAEPATADGKWNAAPAEKAPYTSRIVVVRPTDPGRFNGSVIVEWLNVTAGTDAAPDWNMTHRELLRSGYAYVAVSAQKVGIEGAANPGGLAIAPALKKQNPQRYGQLTHPGDAYSFDIYSQAGQLVRTAASSKILGPLVPKRVLAIGESQSAAYLTTYINAVDPLVKVYDGFLVHSRFGGAPALPASTMTGGANQPRAIKFRRDLRVPVLAVETETDVLDGLLAGYRGARQPDHERLRVWEVPGTAHADNYSFNVGMMDSESTPLAKLAAAWAPMSEILGSKLAKPINNAPQHHYVVQNALACLNRWVSEGKVPPSAEPMKLEERTEPAAFAVDANGLTAGGVRTPWVDVPIARLAGNGNAGSPLAFLVGTSEPFDAATLERLYPAGKKEYLKKFEVALDSAIKAGFILAADRKEILELAALGFHGSR